MTLASIVSQVIMVINLIVGVLSLLALVLFLVGGVRYIYRSDDAHRQARKEFLGWSLVALFVMVSVFGILKIVQGMLVP